MNRHLPLCVVLSFVLCVSAIGQYVCPTVSPAILPAGVATGITITVADATGAGYQYRTNCLATSITQGSVTGPFLNIGLFLCLTTYITVPPYGSASKSYTLPALTAGDYYIKFQYRLMNTTTLLTEYVPFQVATSTTPNLTATTIAQVGQTLSMTLSAPTLPGETYVVAASLSTNTGILVAPGLNVSLDPDAVFALTFPAPLPGIFDNFQGVLDGAGFASSINVNFPYIPAIAYLPFHVQGAVVPILGSPVLTNCLNLCIAP